MEKYDKISYLALSESQLEKLVQIREFLQIPHLAQECLSAERTPTLPVALPAYEELLALLKVFKGKYTAIADGVQAAIAKLEEYYNKSRGTPIYAAAMSAYTFNSGGMSVINHSH